MRVSALIAAGALSLSAGCAAKAPSEKVINDDPGSSRWTGSLQPTQQRTGAVAVTTQNRAFGSITISTAQGTGASQRMRVNLTASISGVSSQSLRWAILPDRCGAGNLPVIGFEQFPLLEIGNNGRGEVMAELPIELTPNNVYHVNVYDGRGQQLDNVLTCGNLKFETVR